MNLIIAEIDDTAVSLDLTLSQSGVGGITGKAPTVAFRDATSLVSYLDFSDSTFKTAGWTTKYEALSEVGDGHYSLNVDLSLITPAIAASKLYVVEYAVDDGGSVKGAENDLLLTVKAIGDIPGDVWEELTSAHTTAGTYGLEVLSTLSTAQATQLLEIYRILGLDDAHPLVVSKTARTAGSVISQTIQENVPVAGSVTVTRIP